MRGCRTAVANQPVGSIPVGFALNQRTNLVYVGDLLSPGLDLHLQRSRLAVGAPVAGSRSSSQPSVQIVAVKGALTFRLPWSTIHLSC